MAAKESPRTKRHITVRIDEGVMAGVDEVVKETGASMSAAVESLLAAGLESRSGAGELDAVLDRRIDELFEKIDARIADMSAAADARAERSASAAAKSLDRAARDINTVRKNAGYSKQMNQASQHPIPTHHKQPASIDGANAIQKLIAITVPNMKSCFALLFVTGMINGLARFTDIYILGGMDCYGGAGGTLQTILMYVFQFSFETPNYGVASAGSMVLFALVFVMTMINVKLTGFLKDDV